MGTATLQRKSFAFTDVEFKADKPGTFRARIATLNAVDKDGDVSLPGSFPNGKAIVISAYMHTSWMGALPVGKGVIGSDDKEAWVDGQFFIDTTDGANTYKTVKALAEDGLGEWSYGYDVLDRSTDPADLEAYPGALQIFKRQDVFEASPVLIGAGVNTGTEFVKSIDVPYADHAELALATVKAWVDRSRDRAAFRAKEGRALSANDRERLTALTGALKDATVDVEALLASAEPSDPPAPVEPPAEPVVDEELTAIWLQQQQREADFAGLLGQA
jgi:hypothetical protein